VNPSKRVANLTIDRVVKSLKWKEGDPNQFEVKSEGHPGYYLRVSKGGTKSWIYRYTFKGRVRRLPLGRYPSTGCADAFSLYKQARELQKAGVDPLGQKKDELAAVKRESNRSAFTVSVLFHENYWPRFATKKRSAKNDWHYFTVKIEPILGLLPADSVTPDDVERLIRPLERKGFSTGRLTLAQLRKMYNWAVLPESAATPGDGPLLSYNIANPCRLYRLDRSNKPPPIDRYLIDQEIAAIWKSLGDSNTDRILKLQLLTGCRVSEVCGMTESELDRDAMEWSIPAERSKNNRPHLVPLTDHMLQLIGPPSDYFVFSTTSKSGFTTSSGPIQCIKRHCRLLDIRNVSTHTMRRTFITNMARLNIPTEIRNRLTNHADQSVDGIYNQHDYLEQKRIALKKLDDHLGEIISGIPTNSNVVPIVKNSTKLN
jgi:integrase